MNNTEPYSVDLSSNMLDDVVRFYESQITEDEKDWIRSPILSTFDINEVRESTWLWWPFPWFTANTDSYWSVNLEPDRTTQRTTTSLSDWFKTVKWYRALKSWRYIIEWNISIVWWWASWFSTLNGIYGYRLLYWWITPVWWSRTVQHPRVVTEWWFLTIQPENNYRTCIYLQWWQYFILQAYLNVSTPRRATMTGKLKVIAIEDKFITWQI